MKKVRREDLLDYQTYTEQRDGIRASAMAAKNLRRVHVGEAFTFLFENPETIRYQVLEMMRVEQMVREADIQHELDTYNEILGEDGDLGATLLVEIADESVRREKLKAWRALPGHIYARLDDGSVVRALADDRQADEEKVSSVQFLRFPLQGRAPAAIGVDLPGAEVESVLSDEQKKALAADLAN